MVVKIFPLFIWVEARPHVLLLAKPMQEASVLLGRRSKTRSGFVVEARHRRVDELVPLVAADLELRPLHVAISHSVVHKEHINTLSRNVFQQYTIQQIITS